MTVSSTCCEISAFVLHAACMHDSCIRVGVAWMQGWKPYLLWWRSRKVHRKIWCESKIKSSVPPSSSPSPPPPPPSHVPNDSFCLLLLPLILYLSFYTYLLFSFLLCMFFAVIIYCIHKSMHAHAACVDESVKEQTQQQINAFNRK